MIRIDASQLKAWSNCREYHRLGYLENIQSAYPKFHYHYGKVIHTIAENYWNGADYMSAFKAGLLKSQELNILKLNAKDRKRWVDMCEAIAPITTVYYAFHGNANDIKPTYNEHRFEFEYSPEVTIFGMIDRLREYVLTDTKTASAVGPNWKADLKRRLLREPQLPLYFRLCTLMGLTVEKIQYEIIVKPYRGSEPYIEVLDCTNDFLRTQKQFEQVMDWHIQEIRDYYQTQTDTFPWPMNHSSCTASVFGDCEYLDICLGRESKLNRDLFEVKSEQFYAITGGPYG
jgi:hypothetical protein